MPRAQCSIAAASFDSHLCRRIRGFDIRDQLQRIRVPTVIAGGDCDPIIPYCHTLDIASRVPNSQLAMLPGTGHLFFAECTSMYHELLERWIRQLDQEPRGRTLAA